ncbi:pentatricopeptide repeat-containing protein chloroplastic-like [Dorcoceras hygrometricum]|uniref:Pentatricopeptide repeat-containing protein chloroplastic-like n=1 Tax=Dorcoceras hygrometricum TaxID=472368 RepID=A0A2Z7DGR8_9LAMI|nr:pentatricopeptide repeat-containing protein chloroplastic-like [Dorcoceras hygrometricum]
MYYELMDPCDHDMVKWQHRGVRDPEIEQAGPLGSLGLNGAGDDPVNLCRLAVRISERPSQLYLVTTLTSSSYISRRILFPKPLMFTPNPISSDFHGFMSSLRARLVALSSSLQDRSFGTTLESWGGLSSGHDVVVAFRPFRDFQPDGSPVPLARLGFSCVVIRAASVEFPRELGGQ